jgi:hypothetical protein
MLKQCLRRSFFLTHLSKQIFILFWIASLCCSFVYIDQKTAKLTKTLAVAFDSWEGCRDGETAMWARASSMEEAMELAVGFMKKYNL